MAGWPSFGSICIPLPSDARFIVPSPRNTTKGPRGAIIGAYFRPTNPNPRQPKLRHTGAKPVSRPSLSCLSAATSSIPPLDGEGGALCAPGGARHLRCATASLLERVRCATASLLERVRCATASLLERVRCATASLLERVRCATASLLERESPHPSVARATPDLPTRGRYETLKCGERPTSLQAEAPRPARRHRAGAPPRRRDRRRRSYPRTGGGN